MLRYWKPPLLGGRLLMEGLFSGPLKTVKVIRLVVLAVHFGLGGGLLISLGDKVSLIDNETDYVT